ncbi:MAG: hypothetical protein IT424_14100 [Pirellulales bacterium]|nr:hypothetical protein [Pirellulales bacterium]
MRCATGLLILLNVLGLAGCRSQATPLANPFLTPDRVPPPSTQIPPPGAAQPYYPGDAAPAATMTAPPAAYPASPVTPAAPYSPTAPGAPFTPATPATGWPAYQPQAQTAAPAAQALGVTTGDVVHVPADNQRVRFDPSLISATPISTATTTGPPLPGPEHPGAVQQATFNPPAFQRLPPQQATPARFLASPPSVVAAAATALPAVSGDDGFRPRSSALGEAADADAIAKGFRPPSLGDGSSAGATKTSTERFAVGPAQQWLRGQLEYWPQSGEWSIRYMPDGQIDQIGGRIAIDNPQVLANLSPGEFIMVEGQVFGRQLDEDYYRPVYRVTVVQRQRR